MKRFLKCFFKNSTPVITTKNPLANVEPFPDKFKRLPNTLSELVYLETMIYINLSSFHKEADQLSDKAQMHISRGDMYKGMFFLRQRRMLLEESGKLLSLIDDIKEKKQYMEDFPAEFRAAQKIKF
jgi:hypothetical protein